MEILPLLRVIDLETCSTDPNAAVLSVGGVTVYHDGNRWQADNGLLYITFDIQDQVHKGALFDPSTVSFHLKSEGTAQELQRVMCSKFESGHNVSALNTFFDWWTNTPFEAPTGWQWNHNRFICRGTDFDPPILRNLFKRYGMKAPHVYHKCMDLRTMEQLMELLGEPVERVANAKPHHASYDAMEEAYQLVTILNRLGDTFKFMYQVTSTQVLKEE